MLQIICLEANNNCSLTKLGDLVAIGTEIYKYYLDYRILNCYLRDRPLNLHTGPVTTVHTRNTIISQKQYVLQLHLFTFLRDLIYWYIRI